MQIKKILIVFAAVISVSFLQAKDDFVQAKELVKRGFQIPKLDTNFPSQQLFSIADIGPKTYNINFSTSLKMTRSAEYKLMNEAKGCPMLHVKASTVVIDLNGSTMYKSPTDGNGNPTENCVAIEVGYSPRQLAADATLKQPHDVVIRNGVFADFDVAIVVHTGVKNVTFEDVTIINSVVGAVCLGLQPLAAGGQGKVASCVFKNVKIVGQNAAGRSVLVGGKAPLDWAKAKFENSDSTGLNSDALGYGYGADVFMPLAHNPVANNTSAYVYSGLVLDDTENMLLSDVLVSSLGFDGDAGGNTAEASVVQGIAIRSSSSIFVENVQSVNHVSAMTTNDLFLKNVVSSSWKHALFGDSKVTQQEAAAALSNEGLTSYGVKAESSYAITLHNVTCNRHVAPDKAYSLYVQAGNVYDVSNFSADYNEADFVAGCYASNTKNIVLQGYSSNYNIAQITSAFSAGISLNSCMNVELADCKVQHNQGGDFAGIHLVGGQAYKAEDLAIDYNGGTSKTVGLFCQTNIENLSVDGLSVSNNFSTADFVTAVHMQNAQAVTLQKLRCNYNNSSTAGGNVTGMYFEAVGAEALGVQSLHLADVEMNNNSCTVAGKKVQGIIVENGDSISIDTIAMNGNVGASDVIGYQFATKVNNLEVSHFSVNGNSSSGGNVKGCTCDDAQNVYYEHGSMSGNSTTGGAGDVYGIELLAVETARVRDVAMNNNVCNGGNVYGIAMDGGQSVSIDGLNCNYNQSGTLFAVYGIQATTGLYGSYFSRVSCNNNVGGLAVYGLDIENASSLTMNSIAAVSNAAVEHARGLYIHGGEIISCKQADLSANKVTALLSDPDLDDNAPAVHAENALQLGDISKHAPSQFTTGAYGAYLDSIDGLIFEQVQASRNNGFRATGIAAKNVYEAKFKDCLTSYQAATGNYFIDDPFAAVPLFTEVSVPLAQQNTIFGGLPDDTTVDIVSCVKDIFHAVSSLRAIHDHFEFDFASMTEYGYRKTIVSTQLLLRAIIAQFRRYGTALGLHMHDCNNCHVLGHQAIGNQSEKDSAIGLVTTGSAIGHIIDGGIFSNNEGWTDSKKQQDVNETIDITQIMTFWQKLGMQMLNVDGTDNTVALPAQILKTYLDRLPLTMSVPFVYKGRLVVSFDANSAPFYELIHPVGGMGAGIVIGDAASNIEIKNCVCASNQGGAGQAYGILQDVTTSGIVQDNRIYQMHVNTLGYGYGLTELSFQSNSVHAGNVLFGNAIDRMLNANYFVPYSPEYHSQLSFQVKTIHNGDFSVMANALPYDNIEISFVAERSADLNMPDDVKNSWIDQAYAN